MNQNSVADVASAKSKVSKLAKGNSSIPVRISAQGKGKLDALVARINKDRVGRRVKPDDLICYSLDLLTDQHLQEIGARLLTNKERMEILYGKLSKANRGLSRDEFLGMLLEGKVTWLSHEKCLHEAKPA
ncbi:hypothetical protein E3A20_08360 [Planctomyces bekefii]|uniref:Uncharacterized protein n=1 Tax=Planctomyces bekefii TaxID=1653850 RepID=A0A5C6M5H0_9PLAN|nr:hypothetical protein E3A20_08360 [Planctomyces bekefii]